MTLSRSSLRHPGRRRIAGPQSRAGSPRTNLGKAANWVSLEVIGNENVDPKGSGPTVSLNVFTGPGGDDRSLRSLPQPVTLKLRWESALPVRLAELKSHEVEPLTMDGDGYRIAVYGIPRADVKGDPKELGKPLRNLAVLKRGSKRDVKPVSARSLPDGRRGGGRLSVPSVR
jgi:hypothetical protein